MYAVAEGEAIKIRPPWSNALQKKSRPCQYSRGGKSAVKGKPPAFQFYMRDWKERLGNVPFTWTQLQN
jgi:hypothetical protein